MRILSGHPLTIIGPATAAICVWFSAFAAPAAADDPNRYHWDGQDPYFEGWYFKVSDPEAERSYLFIYAVYSPAGTSPESCSFIMAGINSPGTNDLIYARYPVESFTSDSEQFDTAIGSQNRARGDTETLHARGSVSDNDSSCSWNIDFDITHTWENTMGWMARLPDLQTYWHVGAMKALASGWIEWNGDRFEFDGSIGYQEKNWGDEFPETWFWLQANDFDDQEACCLSVGGASMPIGPLLLQACGIGFRFKGRLYTFSFPQQPAVIVPSISPGSWQIQARKGRYRILIDAECDTLDLLNLVNPTIGGIKPWTWESTRGTIRVRLHERRAGRWHEMTDTESGLAGTEFGGKEWIGWDGEAQQ